jgi:hypothetical protein
MDINILRQMQEKYGIPDNLLYGLVKTESGGVPRLGPATDNFGKPLADRAAGYFQWMPATAKQYGVKVGDFLSEAEGAAQYLSDLARRHGGDWNKALAAYGGHVKADPTPYINKVRANALPDMEDEGPVGQLPDMPDLPDMPEDVPARQGLEAAAWGPDSVPREGVDFSNVQASNSSPINWQTELDNAVGTTILPLIGGVGGSIVGGAAGAPSVIGAPAGSVMGGVGGSALGLALAIRNHPAPIEEKLNYLSKHAAIDTLMGGAGFKGADWIVKALATTDPEKLAIREWFKKRGSRYVPEVAPGMQSTAQAAVYKEAAGKMDDTVNAELGALRNKLLTAKPTESGAILKQTQEKLKTTLDEVVHDKFYAPYKSGTVLGDSPVTLGSEAIQIAKNIKAQWKTNLNVTGATTSSKQTEALINAIAKGDPIPLHQAVSWKRLFQSRGGFNSSGDLPVDASQSRLIAKAIDESVGDSLGTSAGPVAKFRWNKVNELASKNFDTVNADIITKALEKDPMLAADYIARETSPTTVAALDKYIQLAISKKSMSPEDATKLRDAVKRNWLEINMKDSKAAANIYRSLQGNSKDAEVAEGFNALFNNSPYKGMVLDIGKAADRVESFRRSIDPSIRSMGPGAMTVAASIGSIPGVVAGSPLLGATVSAATVGTLMGINRKMTVAAQRAVTAQDKATVNRIRAFSRWMAGATALDLEKLANGNLAALPMNAGNLYQAIMEVGEQ